MIFQQVFCNSLKEVILIGPLAKNHHSLTKTNYQRKHTNICSNGKIIAYIIGAYLTQAALLGQFQSGAKRNELAFYL